MTRSEYADTEAAITRMERMAAYSGHWGLTEGRSPNADFLRSLGMEVTQENLKHVSDEVQSSVRSGLEAFAKVNRIKQEVPQ